MRNLNKVIRNAATNGRSKQQELQLFLRAYRATPHSVTKIAPNDLLFGFNKTSGLPSSRLIQRDMKCHEIARANDIQAKEQMKRYYDSHKHVSECPITFGTEVYLKLEKVNKSTPVYYPNMYEVINMNRSMITAQREGHIICRNSSFFKRVHVNEDETENTPAVCKPTVDHRDTGVHEEFPVGIAPAVQKLTTVQERHLANKQQQALNVQIRQQNKEATGSVKTRYGRTSKPAGQFSSRLEWIDILV